MYRIDYMTVFGVWMTEYVRGRIRSAKRADVIRGQRLTRTGSVIVRYLGKSE